MTEHLDINLKLSGDGWASLHGFSYLWESEESRFVGHSRGYGRLSSASTGLFAAMARLGAKFDALLGNRGFRALPPPSYHSTYRDGLCSLDLPLLPAISRGKIARLLDALPASLERVRTVLAPLSPGEIIEPICMRAKDLRIFGRDAIVVTLQAADPVSEQNLAVLTTRRSQEHAQWCVKYGKPQGPPFTPHISLGYALDGGLAAALEGEERSTSGLPTFDQLREITRETLAYDTLTFTAFALYAFVDMATFMRPLAPNGSSSVVVSTAP
ncbi:MAG: hypothetical protein HY899_09210 [Deltaproteobacteria bacterium]|nr:hypothetical protein [Deltaproteobacteria bacterium]